MEPGYLGSFPKYDPDSTRRILVGLGFGPVRSSILTNFEAGLTGRRGWYCVGAYSGAAILSGFDELHGCVEDPKNKCLEKLLNIYPSASLLVLQLASVTNYFAYALYEYGHRRRALAGDAEHGIIVNTGERQPEEKPLLESVAGMDLREKGEILTFAISARFLGCPLDRYRSEELIVELVKVRKMFCPFTKSTKTGRSTRQAGCQE